MTVAVGRRNPKASFARLMDTGRLTVERWVERHAAPRFELPRRRRGNLHRLLGLQTRPAGRIRV
jgi:hypothetical protein